MARDAKLSKTTVNGITYWCTRTGGKRVYFGNVKEVSRKEADKAFAAHRQNVLEKPVISIATISAAQLISEYLDWAEKELSKSNFGTKKSCLEQFANHVVGTGKQEQFKRLPGQGKRIGHLAAIQVTAGHLLDFLDVRRRQPARAGVPAMKMIQIMGQLAIDDRADKVNVNKAKRSKLMKVEGLGTRLASRILSKRPFRSLAELERSLIGDGEPVGAPMIAALMIHIKACWRWGADNGQLPETHYPFAKIAKIKIPPRAKLECELPTREEYEALLKWADHDLEPIRGENGQYRQRRPEECRTGKDNPYTGFADILRCYYAMGPRTGELGRIQVRNVNFRKGQIVLDIHKRIKSMASPRPRVLTFDAETKEIIKRHCDGKALSDHVFTQANGSPWTQDALDQRFAQVRQLAGVREEITIYSFRHLWITDALEAGVSHAEVAEMAGTSISQIEATYGHVRSEAKAQSQAIVAAYRANQAG